jgi:hypothetical protein
MIKTATRKAYIYYVCSTIYLYTITYTGSFIGDKSVSSFIGIDVKSNIAGTGLSGGV